MKTVCTFLLFSFLLSVCIQSIQASTLQISEYRGKRFTVQFDRQFFSRPDTRYTILDVNPGTHYLRIFLNDGMGIHRRHFSGRVLFEGAIQIPANSTVLALVEGHNQLSLANVVNECLPSSIAPPVPYIETSWNTSYPEYYIVNEQEFRHMKTVLSGQVFESTRMDVARQLLSQNYFSTSQITEMIQLFTFESSRLDFAKAAYPRTIDKNNYYMTFSAFSFDSSISELSRYIQSYS
ncbi:MAG: DUF4476 domain-containing protein [Bacteroidia bacterium]|nr:DUF4476 domain-containing protein [Bacteroidia bacterium]